MTANRNSDDYLVARLAIGDRSALGELQARHRRSVVSFLRKRAQQRLDYEQLAGVVFDKVARKAATYEPRGRFKGWLFAIALNVLKDELRRDGRKRARDGLWHVTRYGGVGTQTRKACGDASSDDEGGYVSNELVDVSFHTRGVDVSVRLRPRELQGKGYSVPKEILMMFRRFGLVDGPTLELNKKNYKTMKINDSKSAFGGVIPMRATYTSYNGSTPPITPDGITCQVCARPSKCNRIGAGYVCGKCEREAASNWFTATQIQILRKEA